MEEFFTRTAEDELVGIVLRYSVICTDALRVSDPTYGKVYSLLVVCCYGLEEEDSVFVYDISRTYETARDIVNLLCDNTVTPCTVHEILDDIL